MRPNTWCLLAANVLVWLAASASAQNFNVDLGAGNGSPASSYGAAGSAGTWNTVGLGLAGLLNTDGSASAVSVTAASAGDTGTGSANPADLALIGDNLLDCISDQWSLAFSGLQDGVYQVILYAPSNTLVYTGDMLVDGQEVAPLDGATGLVEGVSYAVVGASVAGGTLDISGLGDGSFNCAGIAGVQLEGALPQPVPALSSRGRALLVLLLAAVVGLGLERSRRRGATPSPTSRQRRRRWF